MAQESHAVSITKGTARGDASLYFDTPYSPVGFFTRKFSSLSSLHISAGTSGQLRTIPTTSQARGVCNQQEESSHIHRWRTSLYSPVEYDCLFGSELDRRRGEGIFLVHKNTMRNPSATRASLPGKHKAAVASMRGDDQGGKQSVSR